jgi:hypothetical protein
MNVSEITEGMPSRAELLAMLRQLRAKPAAVDVRIGASVILAAGMLLGAGIALFMAPMSGAELRAGLRRRFSTDRNEAFRRKVEAEGGLPGPIKHLAP